MKFRKNDFTYIYGSWGYKIYYQLRPLGAYLNPKVKRGIGGKKQIDFYKGIVEGEIRALLEGRGKKVFLDRIDMIRQEHKDIHKLVKDRFK